MLELLAGKAAVEQISRRVVAFIREELGIPHHRERARRGSDLNATAAFSNLRLAVAETVRAGVPRAPGVYEVRAEAPGPEYPARQMPDPLPRQQQGPSQAAPRPGAGERAERVPSGLP